LRTDYSNEAAWQSLRDAIEKPVGEFRAYVDFVSDPDYANLEMEDLLEVCSGLKRDGFAFVVDHLAIFHPEHPILVVDLLNEPGRYFRVIPAEAWGIENNLSIGNMGFEEFYDATDADGIFRGFTEK